MTNEEMFQDIKKLVQESLDSQTTRLEKRMDKKFEKIDKRFEKIDKRFEKIDKRFEDIDQKLEDNAVVQNEILNSIAEKHELIDAELKNHDKRITRLETKIA